MITVLIRSTIMQVNFKQNKLVHCTGTIVNIEHAEMDTIIATNKTTGETKYYEIENSIDFGEETIVHIIKEINDLEDQDDRTRNAMQALSAFDDFDLEIQCEEFYKEAQ